jgi:hypothetical protein
LSSKQQTEQRDITPPSPSDDQHNGNTNGQHSPPLSEQERPESDLDGTPTVPTTFDPLLGLNSPINELKMTAQFINTLCSATLEESNMRWEDIEQLCAAEPDPLLDVTDKHFVKALRTFLLTTNSLQATYNAIRSTMLVCYPDDPFLSFDQMKRHVKQLSGVVPIFHDMCQDTCVGFIGPL